MEKRLQTCCLSRLSTEIFQELLLCAELIRDLVNHSRGGQMQLSLVGQTKIRKASSLDAELGHRRNNGS